VERVSSLRKGRPFEAIYRAVRPHLRIVAIAFVLAMRALAVMGFAQGKVNKPAEDASYRAYRVLIHGIFDMLVVFFLFGDRIVWSNCLTGFAWRAWLLF
jgi:hypothetical protein